MMSIFKTTCLPPFLLAVLVLFAQLPTNLGNELKSHTQKFERKTEFEDKVLDSDGVWLVTFFGPYCDDFCEQLTARADVVALLTREILHVGAVHTDTEAGQGIARMFNVDEFPSVYIFGLDKDKPKKYTGQTDPQNMLNAIMDASVKMIEGRAKAGGFASERPPTKGSSNEEEKEVPSKVVQLTTANFQNEVLDNPKVSMVAFVAPWCGHCKALIPEWEEAARKIDGEDAFFGVVDATVETELAEIYKVEGFPTIKVFPGGKGKSHSDAMEYRNERFSSAIAEFILIEVDRTGVAKEIPELVSADMLSDNCKGANKLCVLAALPHILDSSASGRDKYRERLAAVQKSFRGASFSFLWFEGSSQPELEKDLEMTFGFPALLALSYDKQAYSVHHGSFEEKNMKSFLHSITSGRQAITKMPNGIPKVETVNPWDGQDAAPPEEEFDLADIMGWDEDEE